MDLGLKQPVNVQIHISISKIIFCMEITSAG